MFTTAGYYGVERLLVDSVASLAKNLNVSEIHARYIRTTVERSVAPTHQNVWELLGCQYDNFVSGTPGEDDDCMLQDIGIQQANENEQTIISSGVSALDKCLDGGFRRGMVSEIMGESSTGKTQLCLYVTVCTALGLPSETHVPAAHSFFNGGKGRSVALITTKGGSSAQHMVNRMVEMARELLHAWFDKQGTFTQSYVDKQTEEGIMLLLENVSIACTFTFESAEHVLCYTLPGFISRRKMTPRFVELIVLDSVPPLLQEDVQEHFGSESTASLHSVRAFRLHALSSWLKRLAAGTENSSAIAVIVTNHVHDAFAQDVTLAEGALACGELPYSVKDPDFSYSSGKTRPLPLEYTLQAAHFSGLLAHVPYKENYSSKNQFQVERDLKSAQLGLVWSNCVNARFLLTRVRGAARSLHGLRRFRVVFSPTCTEPPQEVQFSISRKGIHID